ncbi:hypothetical protein PFISCL1PPCAC_19096, partial [Pristionchus fissidentatus]
ENFKLYYINRNIRNLEMLLYLYRHAKYIVHLGGRQAHRAIERATAKREMINPFDAQLELVVGVIVDVEVVGEVATDVTLLVVLVISMAE